MQRKNYKIREESRRLLDVMNGLQEVQNGLLDALVYMYGEEQADEIFNKNKEPFIAAERVIMDFLRVNFMMEMATDKDEIEI